jgi:predicted HAD superfamily Cof-like phosphohydrolase
LDISKGKTIMTLANITTKPKLIPTKFELDIKMFNEMYKLGGFTTRMEMLDRMQKFKDILEEECREINSIIAKLQDTEVSKLDIMVELADLLGDIQVYCASEMARHGLPNQAVLDIIMASNFSKLGAEGRPIYDERGKVQKGPNYWTPEPMIKDLLLTL